MAVEPSPDPTNSVSDLIARSASGDEGAFAELERRYRQGMVRTAINFVDPQVAEEVVQGALLEARRQLLDGTVPGDAGAWLRGIAQNSARDELRARLRQPPPERKPPPEAWVPASLAAPEVAEEYAAVGGIADAGDELSELLRDWSVAGAPEATSDGEMADERDDLTGSAQMAFARGREALGARETLRVRLGAGAPLPLLAPLGRGIDRVRDLTPSRRRIAAGAASAALVATILGAALLGGGGSDRAPGSGPAIASADFGKPSRSLTGSEPQSGRSVGSTPTARNRPAKSQQAAGNQTSTDSQPTQAPGTSAPSAPSAPTDAPPASSPPPAPSPSPPSPTNPPPAPPPSPAPQPPPPASSCGSLSQVVPCVVETIGGILK